MTDTNEKSAFKIKAAHIIIALLIIVASLQIISLFHGKPSETEKAESSSLSRPSPASRLYSRPQTPAVPSAPSPVPQQNSFSGNDPFEEFDAMSRRMSNMMRNAFMMTAPLMHNMQQTMGSNFAADFSPAVDLEETDSAYIVKGDLPGLEKDKINLTVRDNMLTIEGVRQTSTETTDQQKGFYAQERSYGSFARTIGLPGPVDESRINAEYKNGVLTITLPKAKGQASPQKVAIQ